MNVISRFFSIDNRYLPPILITAILLAGQLSFGLLESFSRTILAIVAAIVVELVLSRLITGKYANLASAYITGISVGILLRAPDFWPYALCSAIAITSKYVVRWKGRHLWNPSNLGIVALLLLAPDYVSTLSVQWGNTVWPMLIVWVLGALIVWRVKRLHITAVYVISFIILSLLRSAITGHAFLAAEAPITGPMYQLFIFFMITDPKTTVRSKTGQCVTVFVVAAVEMVLRLHQAVYAPFYALFLVGPTAMLLEMWMDSRRARLLVAHA